MAGVSNRSVSASMAWTLRLSTRPSTSRPGGAGPRSGEHRLGVAEEPALSRAVTGQCSLAPL